MTHDGFKNCPVCGVCWQSRKAFLVDPDLTYLGYQAHFEALTTGLFFFNHTCKTTLALEVKQFRDLYDGPVFTERQTGTDACPGHCLYRESIEPCPAQCECAFVRELIQIIVSWPKTGNPSS